MQSDLVERLVVGQRYQVRSCLCCGDTFEGAFAGYGASGQREPGRATRLIFTLDDGSELAVPFPFGGDVDIVPAYEAPMLLDDED